MTSLDLQSNTPSQPSMDAIPLNPRAENDTNNGENESSLLDFPEPSKDWQFNIFLSRLSDEITCEEFKRVKHLWIGMIGKKVIEECTTVTDVFTVMRQRTFLSPDNLLYLQSMIFTLQRYDLLQMCVEHARLITDVIHFYTSQEQAAAGYKYIQFHVEGKDFSNISRRNVETLRQRVAKILCVPLHNVFIAGVEPSSSMLITLMIPDMYADMLEKMLNDQADMDELIEIGIDVIGINDKQYNIREIEEAEILPTDQQTKLVNVYQQLQTKSKQLDERDIECLKLSKKLKKYEDGDLSNDAVVKTFQNMFSSVLPETVSSTGYSPASLASQSALGQFKHALKYVESKEYDRDLILALLNSNSRVIVNRLKEAFQLQFSRFVIEMQDLRSQVIPLSLELEKYKFLLQVDSGQLDEIIFRSLINAVQRNHVTEENISIGMHSFDASTKASRQLRYKDKMKLKQRYQWPKDDEITVAIENEPSLFLACIYLKEVVTTGTFIDPVEFQSKCLEDVGRKDLVGKFQGWIKTPSASSGKKRQKGAQTQTSRRDTSKTRKESPLEQDTRSNNDFLLNQMKAIEKKVDSIYSMIESVNEKPPSYTPPFPDMYSIFPSKRCPNYSKTSQGEKQED